jgi:hypothetical protein
MPDGIRPGPKLVNPPPPYLIEGGEISAARSATRVVEALRLSHFSTAASTFPSLSVGWFGS